MAEFPAPTKAPSLDIPVSSSIVSISCIDTTSMVHLDPMMVLEPHILGHDELVCANFAFLITHKGTDGTHKVLFDLGAKKSIDGYAPSVRALTDLMRITFDKDITEILGDEINEINAAIWSHHHWDHIGDLSLFPPDTDLIVGPGFKQEYMPGYPANKDAWITERDYKGRNVLEIDFDAGRHSLKLGNFKALDYFGDGSFYLLDCPGHTVGHLNALARTTPTTFVLLGADCCHHGGEFRPTEYLPLPESISPDMVNLKTSRRAPCPGSLFLKIHPKHSATEPFYELRNPGISHDFVQAAKSMTKLTEFDANEDILVLLAHDPEMHGVIDFWPKDLNEWKKKGWKDKLRWAFLKDFKAE